MVWWPFIVVCILLLLLFYPLVLRFDVAYEEENWHGTITLHPFFTLAFPAITLWDSAKPVKEHLAKKKKGKKVEKSRRKKEKTAAQKGFTPAEFIFTVIDILKSAKKGVKRLRVWLCLTYSLPDPAGMGYLTGAIYSIFPLIMGDTSSSRWRLNIEPQWQNFTTTFACKGRVKICLFDMFLAFGTTFIKGIKLLWQMLRRK